MFYLARRPNERHRAVLVVTVRRSHSVKGACSARIRTTVHANFRGIFAADAAQAIISRRCKLAMSPYHR